jgi:hypothetical protein
VARDLGNGDDPSLDLFGQVVVAFSGGTSLQTQVQGSVDNSTFYLLADQFALPVANLVVGQRVLDMTIPRMLQGGVTGAPAQATPRYYRLNYVVVGTMAAGAITAGIVIDRQTAMYYPPGLVIAN